MLAGTFNASAVCFFFVCVCVCVAMVGTKNFFKIKIKNNLEAIKKK